MPAMNAAVPLSFCFRAKNTTVFLMPMMSVRPRMKRIWRVHVSRNGTWVG
jgi:hypothetical protein